MNRRFFVLCITILSAACSNNSADNKEANNIIADTNSTISSDNYFDTADTSLEIDSNTGSDSNTSADTTSDTSSTDDSDTNIIADTDAGTITASDPSSLPVPPIGYRWIIQDDLSDEFTGDTLNTDKWYDYFAAGWKGRAPAKFVPYAISVGEGYLKIKNGILDVPDGDFTYYGGAVTSKSEDAFYGYYESKFIASLTRMSSTFWMSNRKADLVPGNCSDDRYSQELDIIESIGNAGTKGASMQDTMGSNTHYRYIACGESKETFYSATPPRTDLSSDVGEEFHTYGAWWKDDKKVTFYADNSEGPTQLFSTQISSTPFDRPMFLCMVTETYDWTSPVIESDLLDEDRNVTYYDWVRSWKLVPINESTNPWTYNTPVLEESLLIDNTSLTLDSGIIKFNYEYKANTDRVILVQVKDSSDNTVYIESMAALTGYGFGNATINTDFTIKNGVEYSVLVTLQKNDSPLTKSISSSTFK